MADFVFNIAKGKAAYYSTLPATNDGLIVVLLKTAAADATMKDFDTLSAVLAGGSVEADFASYARKSLTSATVTVDDTNDRVDVDIADQTWTAATTGQTLAKLLVCYDPDTTTGTDTTVIPLTAHDFAVTTDGTDLIAQVAAAGFYRAS